MVNKLLYLIFLLIFFYGCQKATIKVESNDALYLKQLEERFKSENWEELKYLISNPPEKKSLDYFKYLVQYHYQKHSLKELEADYTQKNDSFEKNYVMGLIYAAKGIFSIPKAIEFFEKALKNKTKNIYGESELYYNLAVLYNKREDNKKADSYIEKALELEKREKYQVFQAFLYFKNDNYSKAQTILNQLFEQINNPVNITKASALMKEIIISKKNLPPEIKSSYYNLLGFLETDKHTNEVIKVAQQGIKEFPDLSIYYTLLGLSYYMLDQKGEAVRNFEKAALIDPSDPFNYMQLGILYFNLKQYGKSKEYLNKSLLLDKYQPTAYQYLSKISTESKELSKAVLFKKYELKLIQNPEIYFELSLLLRQAKRFEEGIKLLNELKVKFPEEPTVYKELTLIYQEMYASEIKPSAKKEIMKKIDVYTKLFKEKDSKKASKKLERLKD